MISKTDKLDKLVLVADEDVSSFRGILRIKDCVQANVEYVGNLEDLQRWTVVNQNLLSQPNTLFCLIFDPSLFKHNLEWPLWASFLNYPRICISRSGNWKTPNTVLKSGIFEFIEKPFTLEQMKCMMQDVFLAHDLGMAIRNQFRNLTKREIETCELLVKGHSNKEISEKLNISIKTVKVHRANLMRKTQAKSVTDLLRFHDGIKKISSGNDLISTTTQMHPIAANNTNSLHATHGIRPN